MTVPLFDAKGKRLQEDIEIGNGSKVKVAYSLSPYYVASIGAGVSLRLQAIQILDLKARSGGANADYYGFEEEEGYEIGEDSEETGSEEEASQADDAGDF